ncbi:DUF397 domain-containing protein [Actinoallomurus rhizosphaericola]|uniref:DUF397 domain-containing protein n=1 Tax=Actinoallomurus rhizosphaericola TaxID=2952536 RepID=UPI002092836B|nr:DUF397 domain-containing protein [Actinoallomurus rhizosphaericola]MCO5999667.1 DUF397 domain-containing protein [Actinoallomurus rhizosphaericola]
MSGEVQWRKSSRSSSQGGNCVEVAALWRKSSRSSGQGGACVEVARLSVERPTAKNEATEV